MDKNKYYRNIPKIDLIMENEKIKILSNTYNKEIVLQSVREITDDTRQFISLSEDEEEIEDRIKRIVDDIVCDIKKTTSLNMKRVINGTGTILHTNLGRAVISEEIAEIVKKNVTGYSNLEYNLEDGKRGSRYAHFENIITKITGAESAIAVNNNAAAVMLILMSIANDKEVVVSRGELVEIGGSFRVPDIMLQSGCRLIEVGTTNKTHFSDYERAVNADTGAILKVHTSNYKIIGFTESVPIKELAELGNIHKIPVIDDLGSGVLIDLSKFGLTYEPTVQDSIKSGADLVCFSGDKLLGGPQAGIIVGKKHLIDKIKSHPMMRALRIDKFSAAALECVFHEYLDEEKALRRIPVMKMITKSLVEIVKEADNLKNILSEVIGDLCKLDIEDCESQIGGGSLPMERLTSRCVSIKPNNMTTAELERKLRHVGTPVVGRVIDDKYLIDLRTVLNDEHDTLCFSLREAFGRLQ